MTIRVFLIDDHALVRTGIKMILAGETGIEVVGEAESGEIALPLVRQLNPMSSCATCTCPGSVGWK